MLTSSETELIADLARAVGKSSEFVIQQYATWFVASSIFWIFAGIAICVFAFRLRFSDDSDVPSFLQMLIRGVIVFFGLLFIGTNVPDLASPQAAAVHQLIKDVRKSQ